MGIGVDSSLFLLQTGLQWRAFPCIIEIHLHVTLQSVPCQFNTQYEDFYLWEILHNIALEKIENIIVCIEYFLYIMPQIKID